jgi:hypothetical protein
MAEQEFTILAPTSSVTPGALGLPVDAEVVAGDIYEGAA